MPSPRGQAHQPARPVHEVDLGPLEGRGGEGRQEDGGREGKDERDLRGPGQTGGARREVCAQGATGTGTGTSPRLR